MVKFLVTVSNVLTGMRLAKGNCFSSIIAAELFPPQSGYGYLIFSSRTWIQTEFAILKIVILGVLGFLADRIFYIASTHIIARFRPA